MNKDHFKKMYDNKLADQNDVYENVMNEIQGKNHEKRSRFQLKPIIAVCMAAVLLIGCFSGYTVITEAKEYKAAAAFFEEYDLPTEGLTRADIKAIYKDITLKAFSYEKTLEILNAFSVETFSVELGARNREELENLWDYRNYILRNPLTRQDGIHYEINGTDFGADGLPTKSIIKRFHGDELLWIRPVDCWIILGLSSGFVEFAEGTILYATARGNIPSYGIVMMFDNTGNILWEKTSEAEPDSDFTAAVLDNDQIAIFGHRFKDTGSGRQWYFIYKRYNFQGELLLEHERQLEAYQRISTVTLIGDHYLAKRFSHNDSYQLLSISKQGDFIDKISYAENGKEYLIQDIYTYNGKVYLSAMLSNTDAEIFSKEFQDLLMEYYKDYLRDDITAPESYNKRLRDLLIERYTAVLLVCDNNGAVEIAYSAPNARAGSFSVTSNQLLQWQVIRIDDVKPVHPGISSRNVDIVATDFRFIFDTNYGMVAKIEIGIIPLMG